MIKNCRDELLRKKNSIIENLKTTELSLLDEVNKYPRFWTSDGFKVRLTTRTALVLTAEIVVPKPLDNLEQNDQQSKFQIQQRLEEGDRKLAQQLEEERVIEETKRQEEYFRQQQEIEARTQQLRSEQEAILLQIQEEQFQVNF